jgi:hypothetical protein
MGSDTGVSWAIAVKFVGWFGAAVGAASSSDVETQPDNTNAITTVTKKRIRSLFMLYTSQTRIETMTNALKVIKNLHIHPYDNIFT